MDRLMFIQANEAARCFEEKGGALGGRRQHRLHLRLGLRAAPGWALQFINAMGGKKFAALRGALA